MAILRRFWRGWAIDAIFGQTTKRQQTWLSILIGAAVAWPILLAGILAPKLVVQVVAFVPLPDVVPNWIIRLIWCGLAFSIPLAVGLAAAIKAPRPHHWWFYIGRVLRGFPLTLGLAFTTTIILISVPVMRIAALVRRRETVEIPLVMDAAAYREVALKVCEVLNRQGFSFQPAEPSRWISAPIRALTWLGGEVLRSHVSPRPEHFVTEDLAMSIYPSGLLLRGKPDRLTWAHGLVAEAVVHTGGLQTSDAKAQALERRLRPLWKRFDADPATRVEDATIERQIGRLTDDLRRLHTGWEDWQILYRQLLQLDRAVHGETQLLEGDPDTPLLVDGVPADAAPAHQP